MNNVTQQRVAPVMTTIEVLVILEVLVFLPAALLHLGTQIPLGFATFSDATIPIAAFVEGSSAVLFVISAYALISRKTWAWTMTLAAQVYALVGVLIGIFSLAMGFGQNTATNDIFHRIMLLLTQFTLAFLFSMEGKALQFTRMLVRVTGVVQILLGIILWVSNNDSFIPTHVLNGVVFVLALWALAFLAARAGANPGFSALVFIWGLIVPIIGIVQLNVLNGPSHWVIQVVHLLIGMIGIGLGERLARSVLPGEAPAVQG